MKREDRIRWWDKNERLNADAELCLGLRVTDAWGTQGKIIKIEYPNGPLTASDHGGITIEVELQNGNPPHPDHPHEHYVIYNWKRVLRIL